MSIHAELKKSNFDLNPSEKIIINGLEIDLLPVDPSAYAFEDDR